MDPDPGKEIEVDPDPDLDPERGLKWIRPNAVDPDPKRWYFAQYIPLNKLVKTFYLYFLTSGLLKFKKLYLKT